MGARDLRIPGTRCFRRDSSLTDSPGEASASITRMSFEVWPLSPGRIAGAMILAAVALAGCGSSGSSGASRSTTVAASTESTSSLVAPTTTDAATPTTTRSHPGDGSSTSVVTNGSQPAAGDPPLEPSGTFLSSHRLSLSGTGAPTEARSVCRTSPGASCTIVFTSEATTRQLGPKAVDAAGTAAWDWSAEQVGLTVGHWSVRVTASNGSEVRSVDEAIGLEVVN